MQVSPLIVSFVHEILKSLQDIEAFMQNNLMILAEMIKKLPDSPQDGLVSSAVDAFIVFCKRQYHKGKDWIYDLGLSDALRKYHYAQGKQSQWFKLPQVRAKNKQKLKSSLIIDQGKCSGRRVN